jgi:hypothetical protein
MEGGYHRFPEPSSGVEVQTTGCHNIGDKTVDACLHDLHFIKVMV